MNEFFYWEATIAMILLLPLLVGISYEMRKERKRREK